MDLMNSNQDEVLLSTIEVARSKRLEGFSKLQTARYIFPKIQNFASKDIVRAFMEGCDLIKTTATSYRFMIRRENSKALQTIYENEDKGIGST